MIEWRAIPGFEGLFEASNTGLIRGLDRHRKDGRKIRGGLLKQSVASAGYLRVCMTKNGVRRGYTIHRLVLRTFCGEPKAGQVACHNDGIRTNNHIENLRWGSHVDNASDRRKHGRSLPRPSRYRPHAFRKPGFTSPVVGASVERIDDLRASGASIDAIAKWLGFNRKTVMKAANRAGHHSFVASTGCG